MQKKDDRQRWNEMKNMGKKNYLFKEGILYWGVPTGILWAIFYHLIDSGFSFENMVQTSFFRRILVGIIVFSLAGMIKNYFSWRTLEKKFQTMSK